MGHIYDDPKSAINAIKLRSQLAAEEIAQGHAFEKHVINRGEFDGLNIKTRQQYQDFVENILNKRDIEVRYDKDGKSYHLDAETRTIVIKGPKGEGTAFRPDYQSGWKNYIENRIPKNTDPIYYAPVTD